MGEMKLYEGCQHLEVHLEGWVSSPAVLDHQRSLRVRTSLIHILRIYTSEPSQGLALWLGTSNGHLIVSLTSIYISKLSHGRSTPT